VKLMVLDEDERVVDLTVSAEPEEVKEEAEN
jgi:hypothetical protein